MSTQVANVSGARAWGRTKDFLLVREALYQLSYARMFVAERVGFEPTCDEICHSRFSNPVP